MATCYTRAAAAMSVSRVGGVMHWVTSRKIKINRAATAWLIRRFIDPEAVLVFVSLGEVAAEARRLDGIGCHAPGTNYVARDERSRTPFEALVAERCPGDPALRRMSEIVRDADVPRAGEVPEATGLRLISGALPLVATDDAETVERSAFLYDAMYAALQHEAPIGRSSRKFSATIRLTGNQYGFHRALV